MSFPVAVIFLAIKKVKLIPSSILLYRIISLPLRRQKSFAGLESI